MSITEQQQDNTQDLPTDDFQLICLVASFSFEDDESLRTHLLGEIPEKYRCDVVKDLELECSLSSEELADLKRKVCLAESTITHATRAIKSITGG
jgi:hypothetical protein